MSTETGVDPAVGEAVPSAMRAEPELARHPGPRQYVMVAVALAVATAIEVALYYARSLDKNLVTVLLLVFALFKFSLVVLWFMHLRFDNRIFRRLFTAGLVLALVVYAVVIATLIVFQA